MTESTAVSSHTQSDIERVYRTLRLATDEQRHHFTSLAGGVDMPQGQLLVFPISGTTTPTK